MYCCDPFFSHVILQNLIICRITWVFSLEWIDQSAKNYAHNTFLCQNRAFNDTHSSLYQPQFEVLRTNALHANDYKTILQQFMQYISGIKHAAQLRHRTCNTSRISNTYNQSIRWIAQMINPNFWPVLNERHNTRIIRNAGFARDLSNTASFLRPFTVLAETSKQILA